MILYAKPTCSGLGFRCHSDWNFRGSLVVGPEEEEKKEEKEFIKEEEFKV